MLIKIIEQIENGDFGKPYTNTLYGEEILPFGHERFQTLFGPKVNVPLRIQLSSLANKNPLFGLLRRLYRIARGR